jgi:hypothetical protein
MRVGTGNATDMTLPNYDITLWNECQERMKKYGRGIQHCIELIYATEYLSIYIYIYIYKPGEMSSYLKETYFPGAFFVTPCWLSCSLLAKTHVLLQNLLRHLHIPWISSNIPHIEVLQI